MDRRGIQSPWLGALPAPRFTLRAMVFRYVVDGKEVSPTRNGIGSIIGRVFGIVAGLMVAGLVLKLIAAMLAPVLPSQLYQALSAGWNLLYGLLGSAVAPIMAVVILAALIWVVSGRRR
jgi:hypothetical protein